MTREEFIGRAADAILAQRMGRLLVPQASDGARYEAAQWATAALDAVGAWATLQRDLKQAEYDAHRGSCQTCGDGGMSFMRPMPCARAERLLVELREMRRASAAASSGR